MTGRQPTQKTTTTTYRFSTTTWQPESPTLSPTSPPQPWDGLAKPHLTCPKPLDLPCIFAVDGLVGAG